MKYGHSAFTKTGQQIWLCQGRYVNLWETVVVNSVVALVCGLGTTTESKKGTFWFVIRLQFVRVLRSCWKLQVSV